MLCCCRGLRPSFELGENPYPLSYLVVISLLLVAFVAWRRIKPPAQPLLRIYAGVAATLVFASSSLQTCVGMTDAAEPGCRFILGAAVVVIASLSVEILLWWRARRTLVPRAIARRRPRIRGTSIARPAA